ncbi:MAG TPA: thymidylate synthase [Streptosporangiaceae bacterium]|nr:thymidylate synthase [Streptosporangiaceae bacterium]
MEFDTFHHAYPVMLRMVAEEWSYKIVPRGFPSVELLGIQYRLKDASQRVPFIPGRRLNIIFNFAEALWYLSGRDDLSFISYYAPSIRKYSADNVRLTGTAYGRAIFGQDECPYQWATILEVLRSDRDSKRAVLQIFRAAELNVDGNPDVSCTLGLQFMVRSQALHAVGFMRANDAYRGMTSDVFSFTLLQEVLARQLGVRLGEYIHSVGSFHVYDTDKAAVAEVLADSAAWRDPRWRFPAMPDGDNWPYIQEVLVLEEALRENRHRIDPDLAGMPGYWIQVLLLFEIYRRLRLQESPSGDIIERLWPVYRTLIGHRWPHLLAAGA